MSFAEEMKKILQVVFNSTLEAAGNDPAKLREIGDGLLEIKAKLSAAEDAASAIASAAIAQAKKE